MIIDDIVSLVRSLPGSFVLSPVEGSDVPEAAWGDHFCYYAPDGLVPTHTQPYATVVTNDQPGDAASQLDAPDRFRVNVHVGRDRFADLLGHGVGEIPPTDHTRVDVVVAHPVYGRLGWIAVVNPGVRTSGLVADLLRDAHARARDRTSRVDR